MHPCVSFTFPDQFDCLLKAPNINWYNFTSGVSFVSILSILSPVKEPLGEGFAKLKRSGGVGVGGREWTDPGADRYTTLNLVPCSAAMEALHSFLFKPD